MIAVIMGIILLILTLKFLMYLYRVAKLSSTLEDKLSISRQVRPSIGNKLHRMPRASYILNAKVEWFKDRLQSVSALNSVRFESNAVTALYNSKTPRSQHLVQEHIVKGNPTNSEVINSVLLNKKVAIS